MTTCPYCGHDNEAHTCVGPIPAVPHDGDYSLCIACGFWGIFEGGAIRRPDRIELVGILRNPECMRVMDVWVEIVKRQRLTEAWN